MGERRLLENRYFRAQLAELDSVQRERAAALRDLIASERRQEKAYLRSATTRSERAVRSYARGTPRMARRWDGEALNSFWRGQTMRQSRRRHEEELTCLVDPLRGWRL